MNLKLLCHVGDIDIALCDVRDHSVDSSFVLLLLKIRMVGSHMGMAAAARHLGAVLNLRYDLRDGSLRFFLFSVGGNPKLFFQSVFNQIIVKKSKLSFWHLNLFGMTAGNLFKFPAIVIGQIADGSGNQRKRSGILFPMFS